MESTDTKTLNLARGLRMSKFHITSTCALALNYSDVVFSCF